jgi:hypothetical protein
MFVLARFRVAVFTVAVAAALLLPATSHATPTFLSAVNISASTQDAFEPAVDMDNSGNVIAVWTRSDGANLRIQAATRTPGGAWTAPVTLSDPPGSPPPVQSASSPELDIDSAGNALVVWSRFDGTNRRIQASFRPSGGSFGTPVTVSDPGGDADEPDVSFDGNNRALVVWDRYDGTKLRVQAAIRSAGSGGTFGAIQTLSDPGQDAYQAQATAGPDVDSNAAVVWTRSDGTNLRVQSSRRRDPGGFPRPKGAGPVRASLVPAYNQCTTAANRTHGLPLALPSCNPPVQSSSVLTVGTLDKNGFSANFIGSVRFLPVSGNTATEANEADIKLIVSLTDIRNNPSGTDYAGRLLVTAPLQITDNLNSLENPEPGTTQQTTLKFPVTCVGTADTAIGGSCLGNTSMNAIYPGAVLENKRSNWEIGTVTVNDAGPNGTGYASCPPTCGDGDESAFLRQGFFTP